MERRKTKGNKRHKRKRSVIDIELTAKKVEKRNIYRNENGEGKGGKEGLAGLVKKVRQSPEQMSE